MIEHYCKVNEAPTHKTHDNNIACQLDICYWNIGLEFIPNNCACKDIHISQGAECLSFISKAEAKKRLDKAFREDCDHNYEPTFQGGDTYKCFKCGREIDMTED